jgi:hypothetical protein
MAGDVHWLGRLVRCSCCRRSVQLEETLVIGVVMFCGACRPALQVLEDWEQRAGLLMGLGRADVPPCPHGL